MILKIIVLSLMIAYQDPHVPNEVHYAQERSMSMCLEEQKKVDAYYSQPIVKYAMAAKGVDDVETACGWINIDPKWQQPGSR